MEQVFSELLNKIADPILALLILGAGVVVFMLFKSNKYKQAYIEKLHDLKATEVKELNKILLDVRQSDTEMLVNLENSIDKWIDTQREYNEAQKAISENLRRNNELLMQLIAKVDYSIHKT
jgi:hypothetical protein